MAMRAQLGAVLLGAAPLVAGHGSLVSPAPRNSVDRSLAPWEGGKFAPAGELEPFGCNCVNRSGPCESALSCFWFSNGCTIGCPQCTGNGTRGFGLDTCGSKMKATNNDPRHRTLNRGAEANSAEDLYRFNPWRSPGNAPSFDPCGMAGGTWKPAFNGAEYPNTSFARQGDLGSKVLKPLPTGVRWEVGSLVEASFFIKSNHGGGYQYRLCPLDEGELTEECFKRTPLPFGSHEQVVRFKDREERFNGTFVSEGVTPPGHEWAMNPIPMCGTPTTHTSDPSGNVHTCPGGTPPVPAFPYPAPGVESITSFVIVDTLRIPLGIKPGKYVLGWRWDAEQTTQVWGACADIEIVARSA